jgi:hypothetical protein
MDDVLAGSDPRPLYLDALLAQLRDLGLDCG